MTLTLEEQERRAYADGDVERAELLRMVIDAQDPWPQWGIDDEDA